MSEGTQRGLAAIVAADVVGYRTALRDLRIGHGATLLIYTPPELMRANANTAIVRQKPRMLARQSNKKIFAYLGMHLILH